MLEIIGKGGPVMWLILLSSVVGAVVFLDRFFALHRAQIRSADFLKGIFNILGRGNTVEAIALCDETPGPIPRVVQAAILRADDGPLAIRQALEETARAEVPRLEQRMGLLATVAQITPLMGLLGTVLGMMKILLALQQKAPLVHAGDLAAGLWQALICTAAGLVVAIPAYAGYNFLVSRVESVLFDLERVSSEVLSFLARPPTNGEEAREHA